MAFLEGVPSSRGRPGLEVFEHRDGAEQAVVDPVRFDGRARDW